MQDENLNEIDEQENEDVDINAAETQEIPSENRNNNNFLKAPISTLMNKLFGKNSSNRKKGFEKIVFKLPMGVKIFLIVALIFIVIICAILIAMGDDAFEKTSESRDATVDSFNITDSSSEIDKEALKLYKTYDSLIGFNDEQLKKIYSDFLLTKNKQNQYLVTSASKKIGSKNGGDDAKYSYLYEKPLYEHIQRLEKYNFNQIYWREYSHTKQNEKIETEKNSNLGLLVPKGTDEKTLKTLLETASPFLLTNDIPLGMLCGLVTYSNSSKKDLSTSEKFVYQIIKECMTKITVNKYVLESVEFNTKYSEYVPVTYTTTVKVQRNQNDGKYYVVSDVNITNEKQGKKPTITDEVKCTDEKKSSKTYWYVANAKTYDAEITNTFEQKLYNDNDVKKMVNADSETLINTTEYNQLVSGREYKKGDEYVFDLSSGEKAPLDNKVHTYTNVYTKNVGNTYEYNKKWEDKLSPKECKNDIYKYDQFVEFNTKSDDKYSEIKTDKKIYEDERKFRTNTEKFKKYEEQDSTVLYGLSLIDFIDSNEGIYKKYINSKTKYEGLGRNNLKESYRQIKNFLNKLIKKEDKENNVVPFVYGSSLGYEVTNISYMSNASGTFLSGLNLLIAYINSHEGTPKYADENGKATTDEKKAKYYIVEMVKGPKTSTRTVGYGIDLDRSGNESKIAQITGKSGYADGDLIEKEIVDKVQEEDVKERLSKITSATNDLNLEEYQLHALTSHHYVAGNINGFVEAYRKYWNQERDNKYEKLYEKYKGKESAVSSIMNEIDFDNKLFDEFFSFYNKKEYNTNMGGYPVRQRSEFTLFSGGYYSTLKKFWTKNEGTPGGIVLTNGDTIDQNACLELQNWFEDNLFSGKIVKCDNDFYKASSSKCTDVWEHDSRGCLNTQYSNLYRPSYTYECTWWSFFRGALYFNLVGRDDLAQRLKGNGSTGSGYKTADTAAEALGTPLNTNSGEIKPYSIISFHPTPYNEYGHTAFVEAVTTDSIIISQCSGGWYWQGISIIPRSKLTSGDYNFRSSTCLTDAL